MEMLEYKGYSGTIEYSEEDGCLFGKVTVMNKNVISYEGETIEELIADFEAGIDLDLKSCKDREVKP